MGRPAGPLPRDTRDTLFVLAVVGWIILPHLAHLPGWCIGLALAVLAWRAHLALRQAALPGRLWLAAILAGALLATYLSHGTLLGRNAGVTLVVVLLALKTLEMRARRDALVVFFLGFFTVLTNFLYSQSLLIAVAMVVAVLGLLTALVLAHMPVGSPALGTAARLALRMAVFGLPVVVLLFVLFPRIGPLWGLPQDAFARTGLSEEMRVGEIAEVALDDRIAAWVRFDGVAPPADHLYFRGPVLSRFDGTQWRVGLRTGQDETPATAAAPEGPSWHYELTLEPTRGRILPLLELTWQAPQFDGEVAARMREDVHWRTRDAITERLRLRAVAHPQARPGPRTLDPVLRWDVELPAGFNPRTLAYAAELRRDPRWREADGTALAEWLMQRIRTEDFRYTLTPGLYGRHAIDEFWFDRREGFCEHFAAAFVVMMRALDVPARVVTGFQGAEYNAFDGTYVIRNQHAHAWAEYWQPGIGWVRADPTAAVAPERILSTQALQGPRGALQTALDALDPTLWQRLRSAWDAVDNAWNQWVLNHNRQRQADLLRHLGFKTPDAPALWMLIAALLALSSLAAAAWAWREHRRQDPWARAYARIRERLAPAGLTLAPHATPRALAQAVRTRFGPPGEDLARTLLQMEPARYGPGGSTDTALRLARAADKAIAKVIAHTGKAREGAGPGTENHA